MDADTVREWVAGPDDAGARLDQALAKWWADRSRSAWQRTVAEGLVMVNGKAARASYRLSPGDRVVVRGLLESGPTAPGLLDRTRAVDPSLVWYQDAWILVVNKPRGVVVHPARGHWEDTLVHRLAPLLPPEGAGDRPGIVHRLDRDTTGLMVVAKSEKTRERLSLAISRREVTRRYLAVVRGHPEPPAGVIDAPIARDPAHRVKMAVHLGGRPARTHYRTIARWPGYSLIQCTLETGRTHQIRVHLSSVGHPVAGDAVYGGRDPLLPLPGQALHAGQLAFWHPCTEEALCFVAPVPEDWGIIGRRLGAPTWLEETVYPPALGGCEVYRESLQIFSSPDLQERSRDR